MKAVNKHSILPIAYYDGHCNFCSGLIRFFRTVGAENKVHLIPSQLASNITHPELIVVSDNNIYEAGKAVIQILKAIGGIFIIPALILKFVPSKTLDKIYYWIANNRYHWFGKTTCSIN